MLSAEHESKFIVFNEMDQLWLDIFFYHLANHFSYFSKGCCLTPQNDILSCFSVFALNCSFPVFSFIGGLIVVKLLR